MVSVPYQKRVDLMMEREREKQEHLERLRQLKEYEEVNQCTFKPRLVSSGRPKINDYMFSIEAKNTSSSPRGIPAHERLYARRNSGNTRVTLAR